MKKFNHNLLEHLTAKQRISLSFEAQAREDEAEFQRLADTCPRKIYSGPDLAFHKSWDAIISLSIATECDLRGYALSWLIAVRAKDYETARQILEKMQAVNLAWVNLLREVGLSDKAIQAARPEQHYTVKHLLGLIQEEAEPDPEMLKVFEQMRGQIPVLESKA